MRTRHGSERWRAAAGTVLAGALAFALAGTVPLAFAEEEDGAPEDAIDVRDEPSIESAFRLGDVRLSVVAQGEDAANGSGLVMGVPVERTYLVANEGEPAYVRLASSLACGDLVQPSELGVTDTVLDESAEESGSVENEVPDIAVLAYSGEGAEPNAATSTWRLADDGWWYRGQPLATGERIVVRVSIQIPFEEAWVSALDCGAPSDIEESLRVEAVQARNMSIALTAKHPWGDLQVEVSDEREPDAGGSGSEEREPSLPDETKPEGEGGEIV